MLRVWRVSPDGSRVLLSDGRVTDRYGTTVGRLDPKAGFGQRWADDNRHLCELTVPEYSTFSGGTLSGPVTLLLVNPGVKSQHVASVGTDASTEYVEIRACSVRNDRAVVVQLDSGLTDAAKTGLVATTELKVLRLSTGQVLFRETYSSQSQGATEVTVSDNGLFVAETFRIVRGATSPTIIRELTTGTPVATLEGFPNPMWPSRVDGFTGDATRLIVSFSMSLVGSEIRALDWRSGRVAWRLSSPGGLQVLLPKPHGSAVLLVANDTLWLISADGVPRQVSSGVAQLSSNEQW